MTANPDSGHSLHDRSRPGFIPGSHKRNDPGAVAPDARPYLQCDARDWRRLHTGRDRRFLEAFLVSTGVVALAEIGDKTQLLALVLAVRFQRPLPVALGIFVATLANHALAASVGVWVAGALGHDTMRWVVGVSFLAMAAWALVPDKLDNSETKYARFGVFGTTVIAFFLVEMGDKTQVATIALAARYASLYAVVAGTTLGMLIANLPVVYLGDRLLRRIPAKAVHGIAAAMFAVLGALVLAGASYS